MKNSSSRIAWTTRSPTSSGASPSASAMCCGPGEGGSNGPPKRWGRLRAGEIDLGVDRRRAQHRHADAAARQLLLERFGERYDRVLRRRISAGAAAGPHLQSGDRRGVDDVPALAVLADQRQHRAHAVDHAIEIDAQKPVPLFERDGGDGLRRRRHAGVVDEDAMALRPQPRGGAAAATASPAMSAMAMLMPAWASARRCRARSPARRDKAVLPAKSFMLAR